MKPTRSLLRIAGVVGAVILLGAGIAAATEDDAPPIEVDCADVANAEDPACVEGDGDEVLDETLDEDPAELDETSDEGLDEGETSDLADPDEGTDEGDDPVDVDEDADDDADDDAEDDEEESVGLRDGTQNALGSND